MIENRNWKSQWDKIELKKSIENSKSTIDLFKKSIDNAIAANNSSWSKIDSWVSNALVIKEEFKNINGITYEQACNYFDNSQNPDKDFNLEQFNSIKQIEDKISGEKFFIYQREKLIYKNTRVIDEINKQIEVLEKRINS